MKIRTGAALAAMLLLAATAGAAPVVSPPGRVTLLSGGWVNANLRAQTDFAWTNPAGCAYTDGYMVDVADQGHELFSSMLLTAFSTGKRVQFVLDGCAHDRPRIVSVEMLQ